ncbi:hypothetical protein AB0J86_37450 [Micromonospora sp. NPDC049559]|uniref:hypothetical protein n=1 Tax=Micromonospora sp. NPDC049559 TaxID=3155923 RepID=UPI0034471A93
MLRFVRRRGAAAGVRFCDGCAEVTTAEQRARRHHERAHTDVLARTWPHRQINPRETSDG